MAANERVVNLAVRAKDEFSKVFKNLEEAGRKTQLLFVRDTRKALNETQAEIKKVSNELRQLTQAEGDNRQAVANLVIAKGKLIEKASTLKGNLDRVLDSVRRSKIEASGGYAAFSKMADGMDFTKARAATLQREIADLNVAIADSARKQAALVSKNPFAAADAGRDASNYIAAARAKKEELRALMIEQHKASGATQSNIREWFQYSATLRVADTATENVTAAVAGTVPVLKQKEAASEKAAHAERVHAAAMDGTTRAARRQAAAMQANSRQGARQRNQGVRGDAQEVEVWGLKPWQLTNLGYQINDVVSGLAMGQAPVQILAQQAGQFAQIWPSVMVNLARSIPILAAVGAVLSPVIAAFGRAAAERETLRAFTSELALSADGARYTAEELTQTAIALRNMGVELGEARDLVRMFMREGFQPREIAGLTQMAQRLVAVTGEDLPDAAQRIARAFSGNVSSVRELDRELNFLTASEYEQIRAMEQSGDRAGALSRAQEILRNRLAETVQPTTVWGQAVNDLKDSWNRLVEAIGDSGIVELGAAALELLGYAALGAAVVVEQATDLIAGSEETLAERYGRLNRRRQEIQAEIARALADDRNARFGDPNDSREVRELRNMLASVEAEYQDVVAQIRAFRSEQDGATGAVEETVDATEEQLKNAADIDAVIQSQLEGMQTQLETSLLTSREQYIQNALLDARNAAMQRANELGIDFLELTQEQTDAIRAQAGAMFDAQASANLLGSGMGSYVDRVVGIESSGNPNAQPRLPNGELASSALGLGQFIESTWLRMFREYFPDRAANMSREAILAMRTDAALSRQMIELYARENAEVLQRAGVAVNDASLYLAHFLGPQGAAGVMAAAASTPVDQILSAGQINANRSVLEGRNAGEVRDWAARRMGISQAELAANERLAEIDRDRAETVAEYNQSYQERLADLQAEIAATTQAGREAAITAAIREEEAQAARAGLELTQQQREEIARLTGELYDRQNVEAEVNALMEQREIIMQRLQMAEDANDQAAINATLTELASIDDALETAIERAIAFWEAMGGPAAEQAIQRLRLMRDELQQTSEEMSTKYLPTALEINEQLAEVGANAFDKLAQAAAEGKLTFASFFDALRQGIAQFLIDIGKAIIKQAIFNALSGGSANGGGGVGGFIAGLIGKIFHDGGVVGSSAAPSRMVNPAVFAGASRYHTGGIAGLKPNEVPIIAERGEEVLTEDDPRHRKNASQPTSVKVVNVLDPSEVLEKALGSEVGEKAFINFMARRSRQINGVLGS
ncbi:tape measure protein [Rhodobacter phage RcCWillis]|nr:tape measure protein [Rhodobacter phage RcCWillis]